MHEKLVDRYLSTNVFELLKTERKEAEKLSCNGMEEGESKQSAEGGKKDKKKKKVKDIEEIKAEVRKSSNEESESEEAEFWIPPAGDRWDFDDGGDRWGSGTESEQEDEEGDEIGMFSFSAHFN